MIITMIAGFCEIASRTMASEVAGLLRFMNPDPDEGLSDCQNTVPFYALCYCRDSC